VLLTQGLHHRFRRRHRLGLEILSDTVKEDGKLLLGDGCRHRCRPLVANQLSSLSDLGRVDGPVRRSITNQWSAGLSLLPRLSG